MKKNHCLVALYSVLLFTVSTTAKAGMITTTFAAGNENEGTMFDLEVMGQDISITGADLNFWDPGATTIEIYTRQGGYAGFENNGAAWTLQSTTAVAATSPKGIATFIDITDFRLLANTIYGVYIHSTNFDVDIAYTNGSNHYANDHLALSHGVGIDSLFGRIFAPRTWNGSLYYEAVAISEPGKISLMGLGLIALGWSTRSTETRKR